MSSQDVEMQVDEGQATESAAPAPSILLFPLAAPKVNWVASPSSPEDLSSTWTEESSTEAALVKTLARWPPSRVPFSYGPWITVDRGGLGDAIPNFEGLATDFQSLLSGNNVTVATLDQISKTNNVLLGKWMVFEESKKVDMLWGKIVYHICMERKKGSAKVSTYKEGEKHVICVYVKDYTNKEEVDELRKTLKTLGVKNKCGFKPDAYTHLNIYKDNPWKIRPSRYME